MTRTELLPAHNPEAVRRHEPWIIYDVADGRLVETQPTEHQAEHARRVLNEHATAHGRPAVYASAYCPST